MRNAQSPCSGGGVELELRQQKASFINALFQKEKNVKYVHELKKNSPFYFMI
jgi:indole-3-glycerol phosphate synthase